MKMRYLLLLILMLGWVEVSWGQEMKNYKETFRVNLKDLSYTELKDTTKIVNIIYKANGDTISYQIQKDKVESEVKPIDSNLLCSIGIINSRTKANIKVEGNKVYVYPFLYNKTKIDSFFDNKKVFLQLKDRTNRSFCYHSIQFGIITLPIKWYMNSRLGNVETDINAMISGGISFGKFHVIKFPNEEEPRQYKRTFSLSALAGISKIKFDKNNTKSGIEGNVAAFSTGLSAGVNYQNFTFLIASGFDIPTAHKKDWEFSKTPWLGIGIGYDFLKINKTSK